VPSSLISLVLFALSSRTSFMAGIICSCIQGIPRDDRRVRRHLRVQLADAQPGTGAILLKPQWPRARQPGAAEAGRVIGGLLWFLFSAPRRSTSVRESMGWRRRHGAAEGVPVAHASPVGMESTGRVRGRPLWRSSCCALINGSLGQVFNG